MALTADRRGRLADPAAVLRPALRSERPLPVSRRAQIGCASRDVSAEHAAIVAAAIARDADLAVTRLVVHHTATRRFLGAAAGDQPLGQAP